MRRIITLTMMFGLVLVAGCQASATEINTPVDTNSTSPIPLSPTPGDTQMPPAPPTPGDAALQSLTNLTTLDLASRLAVPAEEIMLIEATEVEWSDSSLGCPQPDMGYLQVITPGYRIVLQVNDQLHEYHTNKAGYFIYCADQVPPVLPKQ